MKSTSSTPDTLTERRQAIIPIVASATAGDMAKLNAALNHGLDVGMTVSDARDHCQLQEAAAIDALGTRRLFNLHAEHLNASNATLISSSGRSGVFSPPEELKAVGDGRLATRTQSERTP